MVYLTLYWEPNDLMWNLQSTEKKSPKQCLSQVAQPLRVSDEPCGEGGSSDCRTDRRAEMFYSWLQPALTPTNHYSMASRIFHGERGALGPSRVETEPGTLLWSLLTTHALNISSDVIKSPEIKCLSQAKQAGSGIQFGQDSGKQTRGGGNPLTSTPTHGS